MRGAAAPRPAQPGGLELPAVQPPLPATAYVLDDEPQVGALVCRALRVCGIVSSGKPFRPADLEQRLAAA